MGEINQQINTNVIKFLSSSACNYQLSIESVDDNAKSIFAHYDKNGDNILQSDELAILRSDVKSANSDKDTGSFSKTESKAFLRNFDSDTKIKLNDLNSFFDSVMMNYSNMISTTSNGIIESFEQGESGDCWLLSQLNGLSQTSWGQQAIKDSIEFDEKSGNYTINLDGVDFTTTITSDEIQQARDSGKYSDGDLDVLLLELATEKYLTQEVEAGNIKRGESVLDGSFGSGKLTMQYLLTGKTGHSIYNMNMSEEEHRAFVMNLCEDPAYRYVLKNSQDYISNIYDSETMKQFILKLAEEKDVLLSCGFNPPEDWSNGETYSSEYKENLFENMDAHEYTIKEIKTDASGNITDIILSNPWDSDRVIHKSLTEFLDQVAGISIVNESDSYEHLISGLKGSVVRIE